jgi:serine/threonine protein phosphatase 1
MSKTIAIGDIHGGLRALKQLVEKLGLQENDQLIFVGDYIDGWSESAQVINFLIDLNKQYDCIFIKGNHDVLCQEWLSGVTENSSWTIGEGRGTVNSYDGLSKERKREHLQFFEEMPLYHLTEDKRLFLHAGFTSMHGVEKEGSSSNFYKDRTLLETAISADKNLNKEDVYYPNRLKHYKEIYIGHTPTTRYNSEIPIQAMNVFNIDTGAAFLGRLSAMDIHSKEVFQSDYVYQLYPDEPGRNDESYNQMKASQQ